VPIGQVQHSWKKTEGGTSDVRLRMNVGDRTKTPDSNKRTGLELIYHLVHE
jgi:hypothetical protein